MTAPTIRDVAREACVSVAQASRAMNGYSNVAESTRQRVLAAASRLDYVPHSGARSLTTRRSNTIGVVLPDLFGEFFSEIIRGIDGAAHRMDLQLLLANMHGSARETEAAIRAMRGRVDGLLVMSPNIDADFLARNLPKGLPVVVINGRPDGGSYACLSIDSFAGAKAMVAYLVECGYRRIAHISGPAGNKDAEERLNGFREAILELLGDASPIVLPGDFSEDAGREAGRILAADRNRIDAVFASNDVMAVGCLSAFAEAGVSVPDDVAIAGFDDVPVARYVTPALTTMRAHIAALGREALETLTAMLADKGGVAPEVRMLSTELVVRQSTRPLGPS